MKRIMAVLVLMGAAWVSTSTAAAAKLRRVAVDGDRITLGDVLARAPAEVARLDLGSSPEPGKTKVIRGKLIRRRLREALISARGLRIPEKVRVVRRAQVLTELQLQALVDRQLPRYLPGKVQVKRLKVKGGITLARGTVSLWAENVKLRRGHQTVIAFVRAGESKAKRVLVGVDVDRGTPGGDLLVKRGEPVVIQVRGRGVTVRAKGVSQQNGRQGQTVGVLPGDGKKLVRGRVVSEGVVEVML